jgi:hypothetical protein
MQATTTFRRPRVTKQVAVAIMALVVAYVLGGASGYLAKSATLPVQVAPSRSVILSAGPSDYGSAWNYSSRRSGTQSVEGPTDTAPPKPASDEPGLQP